MKLTHRLAAYLIAGNCTVLGVYGYFTVGRETDSLARTMERDTAVAGRTLLSLLAETWRDHGREAALSLITKSNAQQRTFEFRWIPGPSAREIIFERSGGRLHAYLPFAPPGSEPAGTLCVSEELAADEQYVRDSLRRLYIATGLSIAVSSLLSFLLGRRLVGRPITALLAKVERVGVGDLSVPMELHRSDELGKLADAIDAMAASLHAAREKAQREAAEREAALRQLRHSERLATVGRLASGIAHELGTPLNVLLARTGMIAKANVPEPVRANAEVLRDQVRRMSGTIRQLLDLSRRGEPRRVRADLREIATRTVRLLAPLATEKGVALELGEAPVTAWATVDADQIQQVITNLLTNAIHASQGRSSPVTVSLARVETAHSENGTKAQDYWRVSVKDRGVGISQEDRERIFEPFFTTKGVGEGTGLGLAIAHGIVAEHDGWITVESEVGTGSEFAFFIPAEAAP
jgi:signal transduction histidine kinase